MSDIEKSKKPIRLKITSEGNFWNTSISQIDENGELVTRIYNVTEFKLEELGEDDSKLTITYVEDLESEEIKYKTIELNTIAYELKFSTDKLTVENRWLKSTYNEAEKDVSQGSTD